MHHTGKMSTHNYSIVVIIVSSIAYNASLNILKDISAAALSKTKALQRELHIQRDHLLRDYEKTAVKTIWKQVKERMVALEIDLKKKARHKFAFVSPLNVITTLNVIPTVNVIKINSKCNTNQKCNKNQP